MIIAVSFCALVTTSPPNSEWIYLYLRTFLMWNKLVIMLCLQILTNAKKFIFMFKRHNTHVFICYLYAKMKLMHICFLSVFHIAVDGLNRMSQGLLKIRQTLDLTHGRIIQYMQKLWLKAKLAIHKLYSI